ncbi:MAG: class I SAM-dependent methyltransferase [Bacteriovoracia bacterium]
MSVYLRGKRHFESSPELDEQEESWWNQNADLINRIWGLPDAICEIARKPYLSRIRTVFHGGNPNKTLQVLEVACGAGWPGQILCDEKTKVTGVDFSQKQIELAQKRAKLFGKERLCTYRLAKIEELSTLYSQYDGVFIHCALHHLSHKELVEVAKSLSSVRSDATVVLVEPVYFKKSLFVVRAAVEIFYRALDRLFFRKEKIDRDIFERTKALLSKSSQNGWFLSPKEMPFGENEIRDIFKDNFEIEKIEPVGHLSVRFSIFLGTLSGQKRAEILAKIWLPVFLLVDKILIKTKLAHVCSNDYLFSMIVLRKKSI